METFVRVTTETEADAKEAQRRIGRLRETGQVAAPMSKHEPSGRWTVAAVFDGDMREQLEGQLRDSGLAYEIQADDE